MVRFIRHGHAGISEKGHRPYVGDEVDFSAEEHSEGYILAIHERKTV